MILVGALTLLAACGGDSGDDDRVLHLRTGDYTEAELRAEIRASGLTEQACRTIDGISPAEVIDIINASGTEKNVVQTPNAEDDLRQGEIMLEECDRLY